VRLLDTLAVCYRGRRITSEGSESHRPRGAMTGAEGAVDVCFGSLADIRERIRDVRFGPRSGHVQRRDRCLLSATSGHCPSYFGE
jgi:hypothetical protein